MRGKECTVIYLITVMVSGLASPAINLENFAHVTRIQDRVETAHGISVHTIHSLVGCAALCLANGNCWSLFYNFVTLICRLNKSPFFLITETTSQSGFHHYSRELAPYTSKGYTTLCGKESILKFVGIKKNFPAARTACTNDGGHLARPRTTLRWTCLADFAVAQSTGVHVWMDISDVDVEGIYKFSDNTLVPQPYHWHPGEPYPSRTGSSDCVAIWPGSKLWDDVSCAHLTYYVCEIEFV